MTATHRTATRSGGITGACPGLNPPPPVPCLRKLPGNSPRRITSPRRNGCCTPRGLLELGLAALAHSVTALAAREFPPEGGSAGDLPDGREDLRPGTPAQPYSLGASILAWLGNKDAADTPDGLTARALAKLTGHPGGDVQAELRSLEGNHLVRRNVQDKVARWSLIPAAGQGQAS
jgi:hypothetical protein